MSKRNHPAIDYSVFLFVRIIVAFIQACPIFLAYKMAHMIAMVAYALDKRHRQVARDNIRAASQGQPTDEQVERMVRAVYVHFARVIVDIAMIPRKITVRNWKKTIYFENARDFIRAALADRPVLVVSAHFGNWEMAGFLVAAIGTKSYAIARDLDNPYLHDWLMNFRQWSGQTILSKKGDFELIQKVLANKEMLISVGDQSAGPRGYFIDFFGRPASTHKANGILAIRNDALVFVGGGKRVGDKFQFVCQAFETLDSRDYKEDRKGPQRLTEDLVRDLEKMVCAAPEQYLWLHNRWKHKPPEKKTRALPKAA